MKAVLYLPVNALLCYLDFPGDKPIHVYLSGAGPGATCMYPSLIFGSGLASYHSLIPDFLGFGYSERPKDFGYTLEEHADSIAYLLNEVQATGCTVIATSMGGPVAITLATKHPELVRRLVLAEGVLDALDVFGIASQTEEQYLASGHNNWLEQVRQLSLLYEPSKRGMFPAFSLNAPYALYRSLTSLAKGTQPSWSEQLYQLKIPRLYIWGEENFRGELTESFTAAGIREVVIPHAGHLMMLDNPAAFVAAILEFTAY